MATKNLSDFQQDVRNNVVSGIQQVIDEIENLKAKEFHNTEGLPRYLDRLNEIVRVLQQGTDIYVRLTDEGLYDNRCCSTHYSSYASIQISAKADDPAK